MTDGQLSSQLTAHSSVKRFKIVVVENLSVRESVSASSNKAKDNKITVLAAEESEETDEKTKSKEVNLKASQISNIDGVKNPEEVDNDRITKTARYYFQPAYKQS